MNSYTYDFHIHSCLSPCGDNEMTPNNIVNMAALSGCDIIAITDHNTCKNAPAVVKAGEQIGLAVIPGMELCTSEEAHIVCLFKSLDDAMRFDAYIYENMPHIKNRPEIFGEQRIMNENDELIGTEENLLLVSSFVSVSKVAEIVKAFGGVAYPAHIDRSSYSVISALGTIPAESGFTAAEITRSCNVESLRLQNPEIDELLLLSGSDAHYLESLADEPRQIELPEKSPKAVIEAIGNGLSKL